MRASRLAIILTVSGVAVSAWALLTGPADLERVEALGLKAHLSRAALRQSQPAGLAEKRLQRVTAYIDAHLRDPLSRALLAQVGGLTEYHFSRMFKVSTGMPPMQYVWRCRIHCARQLLETGKWKVVAAAAEAGFCDQSHLDRQFRKAFGCSPGSVIPRPRAT